MQGFISIRGAGAILSGGILSGREVLTESCHALRAAPSVNALEDFDPKPYLSTAKGYLDEAGKFTLAAAALAMGEGRESLAARGKTVGIVSATRWGATGSGFRFFRQLAQKGPRFASPLVFPHSYANAAGNLLAMEYRFAGPHMVYFSAAGARESLHFASAMLTGSQASDILAVVWEAPAAGTLPETQPTVNGAIALWLSRDASPALARLSLEGLTAAPGPAAEGSVADWAQCFSSCMVPPQAEG